jgi:enoyl-CoA hydratase
MADRPIRLERDGNVAAIVLDNPPLNLFGGEAFLALRDYIDEIEGSDARAAVWRAEGDLFTGGADVNDFHAVVKGERPEGMGNLVEPVQRLEALPIPTLALVHGLCLTAGLEVALGCDMIWATESARFGLIEAVVGLTPGAGGTQRMAERAGPARAREFVMSAGMYDAVTLERWNVVLADGPTKAHAATKRIVRAYLRGGVEAADEITPDEFPALFETQDLQRAVKSFLEEGPGKATFEGR